MAGHKCGECVYFYLCASPTDGRNGGCAEHCCPRDEQDDVCPRFRVPRECSDSREVK